MFTNQANVVLLYSKWIPKGGKRQSIYHSSQKTESICLWGSFLCCIFLALLQKCALSLPAVLWGGFLAVVISNNLSLQGQKQAFRVPGPHFSNVECHARLMGVQFICRNHGQEWGWVPWLWACLAVLIFSYWDSIKWKRMDGFSTEILAICQYDLV